MAKVSLLYENIDKAFNIRHGIATAWKEVSEERMDRNLLPVCIKDVSYCNRQLRRCCSQHEQADAKHCSRSRPISEHIADISYTEEWTNGDLQELLEQIPERGEDERMPERMLIKMVCVRHFASLR